jgi:hypothetical protein
MFRPPKLMGCVEVANFAAEVDEIEVDLPKESQAGLAAKLRR